jgi:hypothetical protein
MAVPYIEGMALVANIYHLPRAVTGGGWGHRSDAR